MIYLKLLITFFKIGLFSFGGGYAMIPLIQSEIESNNWLTTAEFVDIIAIAEMTPGPIAVNSATFVGYKIAGFFGSVAATSGVVLPSFILAILVSMIFYKFQNHPLKISAFYGIRPVIAGLVMTSTIFIAETSIFKQSLSLEMLMNLLKAPLEVIDIPSVIIAVLALLALIKFKVHPILVIFGSGVAGIIIYSLI